MNGFSSNAVANAHADDVATPNSAWHGMARDWELIHDLLGGTRTMRAAGEKWLPREPRESYEAYRSRLSRTVLFNGLGRSVQMLAGRPFSKPIDLSDTAHLTVRDLARNIDLAGRDLTVFARDLMRSALADGVTHILVDYPKSEEGTETLAEERTRGARPYLVHVNACDVIGWRIADNGELSRLRIRETVVEPDGDWGESKVEQIRVLEPGRWQIWRKAEAERREVWRLHGEGESSLEQIPLVSVYADRTGFLTARPPLMDLAWLNLAHWQSSSDQRHILHVARVPILFGKNLRVGEEGVDIGPNRLVLGDNDGADLRYVEHGGAAIEAGRADLADLEDRMSVMGLELLSRRSGHVTATERSLDAARSESALAGLVRSVENGLNRALVFAAQWLDLPEDKAGKVTLVSDDALGGSAHQEAELLLRARQEGDIDRATFLAELRRRGILDQSSN